MKLAEYRSRIKAANRRDRKEYLLLEGYVSEGFWDLKPFQEQPVDNEAALPRAVQLSERFWPREKHERDGKPTLVRKEGSSAPPGEPSRSTQDAPGSARRGFTVARSTLPPPGCSLIWAMYPPDWFKRRTRCEPV